MLCNYFEFNGDRDRDRCGFQKNEGGKFYFIKVKYDQKLVMEKIIINIYLQIGFYGRGKGVDFYSKKN